MQTMMCEVNLSRTPVTQTILPKLYKRNNFFICIVYRFHGCDQISCTCTNP